MPPAILLSLSVTVVNCGAMRLDAAQGSPLLRELRSYLKQIYFEV